MRIPTRHQSEQGVAVIIALVLISFMLALVAANLNGLFQLRREIKLTDQRQRQHWARVSEAQTNAPTASMPAEKKTP
jgi:hypothetical protein